jgi:hypothetical protein
MHNKFKAEQETHHEDVEMACNSKIKDKSKAKADPSLRCFTFDLQQCLATPYVTTSVAFYKHLYWTYNLTIHDAAFGHTSYIWHESVSMRVGNEIASCIYKEIMRLPKEVKKVTFYRDSCDGKNCKNLMICMFLA